MKKNVVLLDTKRTWRVVFLSNLAVLTAVFSSNVFAQAADPYANGQVITIGTGEGEYHFQQGIYGGTDENGAIESTNLRVFNTAKYFETIYGGSKSGIITGTSKINVNGKVPYNWKTTTVDPANMTAYHLWGGNRNGGSIGNVNLILNNGWIYGIVIGGGRSNVEGNVNVTFNQGLIGSLPEFVGGQGEFYAGVEGIGNVVKGNTYTTIAGNSYHPDTYVAGNNDYTIVRQHVLGGGCLGGKVDGYAYINIQGGSIFGHIAGGSGGGAGDNEAYRTSVGSTFIDIAKGEIGIYNPDNNGGNVYGGGYSGPNDVLGNTNIHIYGTPKIAGSVVGAGQAQPGILGYKTKLFNTVYGNSNILIENGTIGGNIYAGGMIASGTGGSIKYGATVEGDGTITLRGMRPDNTFAKTFKQTIYPGYFSGANSKSNLVFDNYQADFLGKAGTNILNFGVFSNIRFINNSDVSMNPANFYAKNWKIKGGSAVTANINSSATLQRQETFENEGTLSLIAVNGTDASLVMPGSYKSMLNSALKLSATDNAAKTYLSISGAAVKGNGSTTVDLTLDSDWDGSRIDLIEASASGSDVDAFVMPDRSVNEQLVSLNSQEVGGKIIWYIGDVSFLSAPEVKANFNLTVSKNPVAVNEKFMLVADFPDNEWGGARMELYNSTGAKLLSDALKGKETPITIQGRGVYELKVTTAKGLSTTVKILVK